MLIIIMCFSLLSFYCCFVLLWMTWNVHGFRWTLLFNIEMTIEPETSRKRWIIFMTIEWNVLVLHPPNLILYYNLYEVYSPHTNGMWVWERARAREKRWSFYWVTRNCVNEKKSSRCYLSQVLGTRVPSIPHTNTLTNYLKIP